MSGVQSAKALRLPPFVTSEAVGELLNWANSIKREFREAARDRPVDSWVPGTSDSDVYEDIVRLLAIPGGGLEMDQFVTAADGEKRRGLTRALRKRVLQVLGSDLKKGDSPAEVVLKLLIAEEFDLAAWLAFERMAWTIGPDLDEGDALVALVEQDDGLRIALGDYWTDWMALPERFVDDAEDNRAIELTAIAGSSAAADIEPLPEDENAPSLPLLHAESAELLAGGQPISPGDGDLMGMPDESVRPQAVQSPHLSFEPTVDSAERACWTVEVEELQAALREASAFDPAVPERLKLALGRLEPLVASALERNVKDGAQLAALAETHLRTIGNELEALAEEAPWRPGIMDAAARIPTNISTVGRLGEAAGWACSARARSEAAAVRRKAALDRVQTDDSDAAGEELAAANLDRRRTRQQIEGEAAKWIAEFLTGAPGAIPFSADTAASDEAGSGEQVRPALVAAQEGTYTIHVEAEDAGPEGAMETVITAIEASEPTASVADGTLVPLPLREAKDQAPADIPVEQTSFAVSEDFPTASAYGRLVESALDEGRYGLAAYLQLAVETLGAVDPSPAPSAVLEALCVGSSITAARLAHAEHHYAAVLPRVLADLGRASGVSDGLRLLAFAGAIKPALFAMQTSAAEAVRAAAIGGLGSHLHQLAEFVVDELPKRGGIIDLEGLRPAGDEHETRDEVERLRTQLLEVADDAPAKKALFARASIIWRDMFQKDGSVLRAVTALRRRAPNAALLAQEAGEELERHLGERCRNLDRAAKRNRDSWLEGKALEWLLTSLREVADLMHGYAAASRRCATPKTTHTAETQTILAELIAMAAKDVALCAQRPGLALAARVTGRVLDDVATLLAGRVDSTDSDLSLAALLDGDLLLIRPYPAEARLKSLTRDGALALLEGAAAVLGTEPDFASAFTSLVSAGRFDEATEAAERVAAQGPDRQKLDDEVADARLERLGQVEARCSRLRTQLDDLLGADTEGRIDPASSVQLEGLIGSIMRSDIVPEEVARRLDFPAVEMELGRLETAAQDGAELLLEPLRREMDGLNVPAATAAILRELADRRELTTLRECVNGLKDGAELDLGGRPAKLLSTFSAGFLSTRFAQADNQLRNVVNLTEAAKERRDGPLVDYSLLAEEDVPAAVSLLEAWQKLKRAGQEQHAALRDLLGELRFTNVRITDDRKLQRAHRYSVVCDPTSDRRDCPVPAFGSAANGKLEVLLLEAVNVVDGVELHGLVKGLENASTVPTLVIVKGLVPADRRLKFMCEARRRGGQESCALLDEAGILFLSAWPGRRRADTFAVALPGGGVQPYSDTSGKTSPEMFFGRSAELGELWRADGPCLVYGGRQLGKTALLEQVRMRNHKGPGQIVVYGSFQGETDIWRKVAQLLNQGGLPVKGHNAGAVENAVRDGLKEHEARRIVILIDEADTYLEKEMQEGYPTLARVRDLMQATERRCKFVFAGLHNVQRLARAPNSPLLHFGTPLRIGPLFGHDLGEAREMVVGPMAAAGIVFGNPTLPNRILSAVGFYPSLLQTFGGTLIARVNKTAHVRLKVDSLLPIVVSEQDILSALEDHDFKENIRGKFRMTLSLDERYRLVTLAMLQRSLDRREQTSIAPSLTDVEVQSLAREWWPQGFEDDSSLDAFQGLLQEMVGLGVLVESGGRYAIRSSRIAAMLGGKEQIERELVELSESPGAEKLDTGSLRRLDRTTRAPSPLTSRQEGQLLGPSNATSSVHLALGSRALGLDRVAATLCELQDEELAIWAASYNTAREFGIQLAGARDQVRSGRRNLLVLSGPWLGREMVDATLEAGTRRSSRSGSLRVLVAPTWIDWDAADGIDEKGRLWGADLITLSTLGRSGLGQWLRARNAPQTPLMFETLRSWTGGYPMFLADLGRAADLTATGQATLEGHLASPDTLASLGLEDERLLAAARIVAQYEPQNLEADLDSMGVGPGIKVVSHLERLGVLEPMQEAGETRWRLNPFVATVLSRQP